jgi:1,4-alpha-glucan branching enzyme
VVNFLVANALFWLDVYHIDGLRVDAVASMLYLDYSRKAGRVDPQPLRRRENLEAIEFLQRMNETSLRPLPRRDDLRRGITAWPGVSQPVNGAGSASASSGTWAGCTTRCATCEHDPCTAAGTTTR